MKRKTVLAVAGAFVFLLSSCGGGGIDPSAVTFDVQLIEIKGATDGIDAPEVDPATLSAGYRFTPPGDYDADNPAKWQVSTYMFAPGAMTVAQGDVVTLRMFGINGDDHTIWVEAPDGTLAVPEFTINRGREASVSFNADQAGHYKLLCGNHAPTMQSDIFAVAS